MSDTASSSICPACGAVLETAEAEGLCLACLLGDALGTAEKNGSLGHIGGHELIEVIARGGMGIVYRARQSDPAREVALKALPGAGLMSDEARQRFKIEAQAMAKLDHPSILSVYELGEEDGTPFFTMKLALGGTLSARMGDYAGKWREIAELISRIAEAVQFAHSHGVLHRDLKPGNILFDDGGLAFVSDFGLAKIVGTDSDLTRTLALMGTPNYMAPEMAHKNGGVTTACDVWSLGVILYELLAGRVPFQGANIPAILRAVAEDEPTSLVGRLCETGSSASHRDALQQRPLTETPYKATIPRDLAVITLKALQKDPARRYGTAQEFADDLRRWLAGEPIHARPVPLAERAWLWAKRKPALAAALALLALTLIGSAFLLVRSNDNLRTIDLQRRGQIHRALLEKADVERQSMTPGRRERSLALVREALTHGLSVQARSVAASALAVSDVRTTQTWPVGRLKAGSGLLTFTADLSHHIALVPAALVREKNWTQGALGLWRTADHALLKQIQITQRENMGKPALSPDMRWLCLFYDGADMEIWDLQQERLLKTLHGSMHGMATFHPADGTLIAVLDGALVRIHLPEVRIETLTTGLTSVFNLAVSPDGTLAAFSQNRDLDGVTPLQRLEVRALADGSRLYTTPTRLWGDLAWTPDSAALVAFDYDAFNLSLHHIRPGDLAPRELLRHLSSGRRAAIWPDGRTLAWAGNGGFLHLHDLWQDQEMLRLPDRGMTLSISADDRRFAYSPDSTRVAIAEVQPAPILQQRKPTALRTVDRELALSPDGRWIATNDLRGLTLWRAHDLRPVVQRESSLVGNLHFSADSRQLRFNAANTNRAVLNLIEAVDGSVELEGSGAGGPRSPHRLTVASTDGRWEATTRLDEKNNYYHLWRDGQIINHVKRNANPHRVDLHSRLISPDGRWAAFGCMAVESAPVPGFTYVIHFDGDKKRTPLSEKASHTHLAISPDSRWLLGSEEESYVIWDSTTWKKVHQVPEHLSDSVPGSAAFSPDGSLLALEVDHGKIRLLRTSTWEEVLTITPPQNLPIVRMAFSADGRHLYTTGGQMLHRWDLEKLQAELTAMGIGW